MSSINNDQKPTNVVTGQDLWRSLDEVADTEEFQKFVSKEFPNHAPEILSGSSRRQFLKVMGASLALAGMGGLTGCLRYPQEKILPFSNRPEGRLPGVPVHYATGFERDGVAHGLLATSFDGRPIKLDGNPGHPTSNGTLDLIGQALVLDLYDPARAREVVHHEKSSSWQAARTAIRSAAAAGGVAVLSAPTGSPTIRRMRDRFLSETINSKWYEYCPMTRDAEREGTALVFGAPHRPQYDFSKARVVVCLGADPLMTHPAALLHSRGFAQARTARRDEGVFHRMFSFESQHSLTGSVADERFPVRHSEIPAVAARIAGAVRASGVPQELADAFSAAGSPTDIELRVAAELNAHRGHCLIVAGDQQPAEVHALAAYLNVALNVGGTDSPVDLVREFDPERSSHVEQIRELCDDIANQRVKSVLVLGGNPVFDSPPELGLAEALAQVETFRLSGYQDETSKVCKWQLPETHFLETWLDGRAWDGTITLTQPLIEPLYGGRNAAEILGLVLDESPKSAYDLLRDTWRESASGDFEEFWRESIHRGFLTDTQFRRESPRAEGGWGAQLSARVAAAANRNSYEIVFIPDSTLYDGRYANNGWLQECPDPMTKIAWDNAAIMSPTDAAELEVKNGDLVEVSVGGKTLEIVTYVMPGHASGSVTIPVGFGRDVFDRVAGGVSYNLAHGTGKNVYPLRSAQSMVEGAVLAQVSKGTGRYKLATTQDHFPVGTLQMKETELRASEFARVVDLEEFLAHPKESVDHLAPHVPHDESLWDAHVYTGHRWGMSIDLDLCTGCTACVVACQAENNIAVTGKDEVAYGREMQWMRIDRYFRGENYENPEVVHQPLTCHQCENAPCEQVCPVAATVHSAEGLNDMVYNRCIGTRYCSNNCPYKVRRFNYFNNTKHPTEQEEMVYNPEVTIRARGVMEKCTYCVQRINRSKIKAKNENRPILDGEVVPACAQTCPTQAITFGDLADRSSEVSKKQRDDRSYAMLRQLNVKPRTQYLARVVNPSREGS